MHLSAIASRGLVGDGGSLVHPMIGRVQRHRRQDTAFLPRPRRAFKLRDHGPVPPTHGRLRSCVIGPGTCRRVPSCPHPGSSLANAGPDGRRCVSVGWLMGGTRRALVRPHPPGNGRDRPAAGCLHPRGPADRLAGDPAHPRASDGRAAARVGGHEVGVARLARVIAVVAPRLSRAGRLIRAHWSDLFQITRRLTGTAILLLALR